MFAGDIGHVKSPFLLVESLFFPSILPSAMALDTARATSGATVLAASPMASMDCSMCS
jgi:hypothetical protein